MEEIEMDEKIENEVEKKKDAENEQQPNPESISNQQDADKRVENDMLFSTLKEQTSFLMEIKELIQERLEYDEVKEKAFDKLYEEMRRQQETTVLLDKAVKPILDNLVLLYDSLKNFEDALFNKSMNFEEALKNFKYLIEELLEVLYRQDVLLIDENLSEKFNSKLQKATNIEKTENKEEDFDIIGVMRSGFTWREQTLRPQEVAVKRFINKEQSIADTKGGIKNDKV
jgi:molecular chaperone GrpE (heat shock protein)